MSVVDAPLRRAAPRLVFAVLLAFLAAGSGVALVAVSAWLLARASEQPPVLYLMVAIVAVRTFGIGKAGFRYAERLVGHSAALGMLAGVRVAVYRQWERLYPGGIRLLGGTAARGGDLVARAVADTEAIVDLTVRVIVPLASVALVAGCAVVASALLLPATGVVLAVSTLAAGVAVPMATARWGRPAQAAIAPARGAMAAAVAENLAAAAELRVYGVAGGGVDAVIHADADLVRARRRLAATDAFAAASTTLVVGLTVAAQLVVGAAAVASGRLAPVQLGVVVLLPLAVHDVVAQVAPAVSRWQQVRSSLGRLEDLATIPDPVPDPAAPRTLAAGDAAGHRLELRGVSACWPGATTDGLRGIDLDLGRSRRIGVVGRSGAGKSTLAMVLARFVDVDAGSYTIDGVPVGEVAADDVRRVVGLQTQDAHVFDTTVRENLRPARPDASSEALITVLDRVGLGGWVASLPRGLDTPLGADGRAMSGGERQRLGLARLLLASHPVLVFDEPAEHLDPDAASALLHDLLRETSGRSVLLITHSHDGLAACDEVVVMEHGTIVDRGPYRALLGRQGPFTDVLGVAPVDASAAVVG